MISPTLCLTCKIIVNLTLSALRGCLDHVDGTSRTSRQQLEHLIGSTLVNLFCFFSVEVVRKWNSIPTNIKRVWKLCFDGLILLHSSYWVHFCSSLSDFCCLMLWFSCLVPLRGKGNSKKSIASLSSLFLWELNLRLMRDLDHFLLKFSSWQTASLVISTLISDLKMHFLLLLLLWFVLILNMSS